MALPIFFVLLVIGIQAFAASGCVETERNALLAVNVGLTDPGNRLSSWEGQDCCKWRGVVCSNTTGHVLKLNLRNSYNDVNKRPSPALSAEGTQIGFLQSGTEISSLAARTDPTRRDKLVEN
ncbi:LRR receptor-like serine/threonine-protein kinase ERL2 [Ananas comosus]|uniref:LRR receptor-like serine/threonine-protein kinase ERL2 n=1 Tax=Ananas comosus TaxID=4615 RepID=A0A6P5FN67_ANACO|nr:LRR receptor-like serine/threonine-protein kinase ERL2 [Ananas comosus]